MISTSLRQEDLRPPVSSGIPACESPPDHCFCFACRCGQRVAIVWYRDPDWACWLPHRVFERYCPQCGTALFGPYGGRMVEIEKMVDLARRRKRGVRFRGLKEHERLGSAADWAAHKVYGSARTFGPQNPAFLEGGR